MTSDLHAAPERTGAGRPESKARTFARLGKLDVYDYYLSVFVVGAAALPAAGFAAGAEALPMLLLFLLGEVCTLVALVSFDDVTGFRDGSDIANYGPNDPLRKKLRKPLVSGALTEREALGFGWAAAGCGALLWLAAAVVAPHRPMWTIVVIAVTFVIALQYSYGLKLSYHGFQEAFLVALGTVLVLAPYGLATGEFSGFVLVQAVLFGLGPLMFGVYSNTNDVAGDRAVGRPTVAALTSPRGNALFIGALSLGEFLLCLGASVSGVAPWWFAVLLLPGNALRARQYQLGFRAGDIMRARRLGFRVHRLYVVLLVAANLLAAFGGATG
ncbi:UbiA family prenyltransferase [Saccharopolyspora sp. NPDC047091]|uniref:UbiA family prenyltransferase n=1 Tax=Saccharopolyspora sp. NPDC047091 TaxID=3155924 RepID=UPI0033D42AB3